MAARLTDIQKKFQSTHPVWGATRMFGIGSIRKCYFNPRTPCGVRHSFSHPFNRFAMISIHAPRVGCDILCFIFSQTRTHFNPRTPCGVRLRLKRECQEKFEISIHAPRVGCDGAHPFINIFQRNFNPRTPCGVRPSCASKRLRYTSISIHAPRVGCDGSDGRIALYVDEFQSTHPVWGATATNATITAGIQFQSTHPVWGATRMRRSSQTMTSISIHAPRVGCDDAKGQQVRSWKHFNPRTPCGVRLGDFPGGPSGPLFQSTHPVWGATLEIFG